MKTSIGRQVWRKVACLRPGAMAIAVAVFMGAPSARALLYVGSSNNSGTIYQYSSVGSLITSTDPGFGGGAVGAMAVQAGTGKVVASTGGFLVMLSGDLSSRTTIGSGFGAFTTIASMSDGRIVGGATASSNSLYAWDASGGFIQSFGSGWADSSIAVGLNDSLYITYDAGTQYNVGVFTSGLAFVNVTAGDVGSSIQTNPSTGQLWTAGNSSGQVLRLDTAGSVIDVVGNGWTGGMLATASNGTTWLASDLSGGLLAAWGSDGTYLGTFQTGIGDVAAITVDPLSGEVYVGLADASGGGINRYGSDGSYLGAFGSNLGITTLVAAVPEPSTTGLLAVLGAVFVSWRLRRKICAA